MDNFSLLAIDDNLDNLISIKALLKNNLKNCILHSALSGNEGIEIAQKYSPDVILLDIQMPNMDGFEVCKNLKKQSTTKHIPIILLTAKYGDTKSKIKGLELGADAFLLKPIEEGELIAQIKVMLRIKKAEDRLRAENITLDESVKQKSNQLLVSENRFKSMFEQSPIGIAFIESKSGKIYEANAKYVEIMKYSVDELNQLDWKNITHPDDIQKENANLMALQNSEIKGYTMQKRYFMKDNSIIWANVTIAALSFTDKTNPYHLRMIEDITLRKKTELIIKQNSDRLNILLELNQKNSFDNENIFNFALEKAIKLCNSKIGFLGFLNENESIVTMHAWSSSAMKECKIKNKPLDFNVADAGIWGEVIRQRKPLIINNFNEPHPLKRGLPEGHVEIINYLSLPVFDNNKIVAVIAVGNKDGLYNETDMQELTLFMDGVWNISKKKFYENELIQAKEKAEESDQLKTEFINNMSHEIRTPLNGILGFSEMLSKPGKSEEKKLKFINIIHENGKKLLQIIEDILEISELGTKQVKIVEKEICLNALMFDLFSVFENKAKHKNLSLHLKNELPDNESNIITDGAKLNKILKNLLENSLKFTNEGYVEFGYNLVKSNNSSQLISKNNTYFLNFYVKDSGIGIEQNKQKIIFKRFSQAEKQLSRNVGGLGLGLSIAKENAELLGGTITLQSEIGKGSSFFVTIPYQQKDTDIKAPEKDFQNFEKNIKREKYTILIAEDEETNYFYLETLLKDEIQINCNILHAKNGKEAVKLCLNNDQIDFILMDLKMPIMNGHEATRIIKDTRPDIPIVAQTSYSAQTDKEKAVLAGCNDFISKPISEETLVHIINKYLITANS